MSRAPSMSGPSAEQAQLATTIAQLEELKKENPRASLRGKDGKLYSVNVVIARLKQQQNDVRTSLMSYSHPACLSAVLFGFAGALLGAYGLISIRSMGKRAMNSREDLLASFLSGQKMLPWIIGGTAFCFVMGIVGAGTYEIFNFISSGAQGRGATKLIIGGAILLALSAFMAFKLVWKLFKASQEVFDTSPSNRMGHLVREAEAPKLWEFVRDIADKAKATVPNNIIIGLDAGFFVTEWPIALNNGALIPPGRTLYLPLPYMAFMKKEEVAAVVGHELGHFSGADTEYSLKFSPIYSAAVCNLQAVAETAGEDNDWYFSILTKPSLMLGEYFLDSFHIAVRHWSRIREFAADAVGAAVAGNRPSALALLRSCSVAGRINETLDLFWEKGGKVDGGFLGNLRMAVKEKGLDDPAAHLEYIQPHPTDSHPTVRQRLEALSIPIDDTLLAEARTPVETSILQEFGLEESSDMEEASVAQPEKRAGAAARTASSLSKSLEKELSQAAHDNVQERREFLEDLASCGTDTTEILESGTLMAIGSFLMGLFTAGIAFIAKKEMLIQLGLGALAAWLFYRAFAIFRRRSTPVMTLTPHGLLLPGAHEVLPWTSVNDYEVLTNTSYFITTSIDITVSLVDGAVVPEFASSGRAKYKTQNDELTFTVLSFAEKMNGESFAQKFVNHWHGGMARAELATM